MYRKGKHYLYRMITLIATLIKLLFTTYPKLSILIAISLAEEEGKKLLFKAFSEI